MKSKDKVIKAINDYEMFRRGAKIVCGVSGGADSVSLLVMLSEMKEFDIELFAVHVNHCLRGDESDRDENYVRELCEKMSVPLYVERVNVAKAAAERRIGTEECARELRYGVFRRAAENFGAGIIATAHNANDNLETAIFNLVRGTGVAGLAGIPPKREFGELTVIRPLIYCSREEIEKYLHGKGVKYVVDSSNLGNGYTRNRIRHEILPRLEALNYKLYETVPDSQHLLRCEAEFIAAESEKAYRSIADGNKCHVSDFLALPEALQGRVISHFYKNAGGSKDLSMANCTGVKLAAVSRNPSAYAELPGGVIAAREYDMLVFRNKKLHSAPKGDLHLGENVFCEGTVIVTVEESSRPGSFKDGLLYIDCDKLAGNMAVRGRVQGDEISLAGHNNRRTLKKLMIDRKIPKERRDILPILCDKEGIVAAVGIGVDERVKIDKDTKNIIKIEVKFTEDI